MKNTLKIGISPESYWDGGNLNQLAIEVHYIDVIYTEDESSSSISEILKDAITDYDPQDKDKLYFLPGTSVPRIKLKDLTLNQGIKSTRKIEDAQAIFTSKRTLDKLTDYMWTYAYKTNDFKSWVDNAKPYMDEHDYDKLKTALEFYTNEIILTDYQGTRLISSEHLNFSIEQTGNQSGSSRVLYIKEDYSELVKKLLSGNLKPIIYDESAILTHLNGKDCVPITEDVYNTLRTMFDSNDTDNHILAMEIMANCNYDSSILYLCMLMSEFNHIMESTRTKNHVNFKSFLTYMNLSPRSMYLHIDGIIDVLKERKLFNKENILILLKHQAKRCLDISGTWGAFQIETITLNDELLKELNRNVTYRLIPEFIPEPEKEEEPEKEQVEQSLEEEIIIEEDNSDGFTI